MQTRNTAPNTALAEPENDAGQTDDGHRQVEHAVLRLGFQLEAQQRQKQRSTAVDRRRDLQDTVDR